jgi:hypothetical protein
VYKSAWLINKEEERTHKREQEYIKKTDELYAAARKIIQGGPPRKRIWICGALLNF